MWSLGEAASAVQAALEEWRARNQVGRLWRGDTSLWTGGDEARWLGWLDVVGRMRDEVAQLGKLATDVRAAGTAHVVLLGMGGSSLCPEVLRRTFGPVRSWPELLVLDSTVPAQVQSIAQSIDPARTLFVVSSKSGTTIEPNVFMEFFLARVRAAVGDDTAGSHFIAITDPGSELEAKARRAGFRAVLYGEPAIGGRYSALSHFGMAPAALMGVGVKEFLDRTALMVEACGPDVPPAENPGVALGIILGTLAKRGRDKVTLVVSPGIAGLGAWLEQLLAESTGKHGKGLVPVADEVQEPPSVYGADRVFVYTRLQPVPAAEQDVAIRALAAAGHPVVRLDVEEKLDLGQEFFRWEIATAVAGSLLGIDPFDQPDVEASKVATRNLMAAFEKSGELPEERPFRHEKGLALFADERNAAALLAATRGDTVADVIAAHLGRLQPGDYFAVNAYLEMSALILHELQALRHRVRDTRRVATTLGFGPRFLHSTGQLHKGGPNRGVFLQLTAADSVDLPIPGRNYGFGALARFQALGDFQVLCARERRILRVHFGPDVLAGVRQLRALVDAAS
jgi:glucose-6-phosphate isomerase